MNLKILIPTIPLWVPIFVIIIIVWATALETVPQNETSFTQVLSRKRRFLAFPEGSSIAVALCMTHGFIPASFIVGFPYTFISIATNWGLAYNLPNATWIVHELRKHSLRPKHKEIIKRRNRRDIYDKFEIILDNMGYQGRECIFRALCESAQYFEKKEKRTMLEEIVRTIFSLPKTNVFSFESPAIRAYDEAYRFGHAVDDCSQLYPSCQFSLLDMAFGRYSEPPGHVPKPSFATNYDPFKAMK